VGKAKTLVGGHFAYCGPLVKCHGPS